MLLLLDNDILANIMSCLPALDYVKVSFVCGKFGSSRRGSPTPLIKEIAATVFRSTVSEYELRALPQYEALVRCNVPWSQGEEDELKAQGIEMLYQLNLLRQPLKFGHFIGICIKHSCHSMNTVYGGKKDYKYSHKWSTALSDTKMRCGIHRVMFTISNRARHHFINERRGHIHVGVMRPVRERDFTFSNFEESCLCEFDPTSINSNHALSCELLAHKTWRWGASNIHCCSFDSYDGTCHWSTWTKSYFKNWKKEK